MTEKLTENDVTPEELFHNRRKIIKAMMGASLISHTPEIFGKTDKKENKRKIEFKKPFAYQNKEVMKEMTEEHHATKYNNFYEFGTSKTDPAKNAKDFITDPWSVAIEGHVKKPQTMALEDLIPFTKLEERIYRFRCVEAWGMVVPWIGYPLHKVIEAMQPTSKAKYLRFETLHDPKRMPGQKRGVIPWPYVEGLRMDEAMHPLTLLVVGMYGKILPNQNGAPIRLIVPWKYGFKCIKSIVKIDFTDNQPTSTWMQSAPNEYGFYANVNPSVDHPRWSQKRERRLGDSFFTGKRPTLMFNGYEKEVASLYKGMDLRKNY